MNLDLISIDPRSLRILRGDGWELDFASFYRGNEPAIKNLRASLEKEVFTVKDTGLTHKVVNQWTQKGILKDRRGDDAAGWRRLTVIDLVWTRIAMELREFGFALDKLRLTYDTLFHIQGKKDKPREILQFGLAYCLQQIETYVIVFSDGWAEICIERDLKVSKILLGTEFSYLKINLNNCARSVLPKLPAASLQDFEGLLTDAESKVISEIRSGKLDKLEIMLENGEIRRLDRFFETVLRGEDPASLAEKILYGDIKIVRRSGKNVLVKYRDVHKF